MYLEESVIVDRPITDVWASIANLFDAPRLWGPTVLGMRQTSPGPLGLGATMRGRMVVLGFETPMDVVINEWNPPHGFALSIAMRPFRPGVSRYALEAVGNGTKLTRSADVALRGPLNVIWPAFRPLMKRGMRNASRNLKRFIEAKPR